MKSICQVLKSQEPVQGKSHSSLALDRAVIPIPLNVCAPAALLKLRYSLCPNDSPAQSALAYKGIHCSLMLNSHCMRRVVAAKPFIVYVLRKIIVSIQRTLESSPWRWHALYHSLSFAGAQSQIKVPRCRAGLQLGISDKSEKNGAKTYWFSRFSRLA